MNLEKTHEVVVIGFYGTDILHFMPPLSCDAARTITSRLGGISIPNDFTTSAEVPYLINSKPGSRDDRMATTDLTTLEAAAELGGHALALYLDY